MSSETTANKFKLNQKVKDDAFNEDAIPNYSLNLQIGNDTFRFCVVDEVARKCLWLEDYRFISLFFTEQVLDQLNLIYDDHQVLQAGFWKSINLSIKNQHFTLIPEPLFKRESAREYLQRLIESPSEPEEIFFYKHASYGIVNVFSAEKKIIEWFKAAYLNKSVSLLHQTSALIEGSLQFVNENTSKNLSVFVEQTQLSIIITSGQHLEYCNIFNYSSVQDFNYYVMLVINTLNLDPETCKVTLYGELSHDSAVFSQLYKYIRSLTFGNKPKNIHFGYKFDEVLDHRYFDVYNIHLCK